MKKLLSLVLILVMSLGIIGTGYALNGDEATTQAVATSTVHDQVSITSAGEVTMVGKVISIADAPTSTLATSTAAQHFTANLSAAEETPVVPTSTATGTAHLVVENGSARLTLAFAGLTSDQTDAHIHSPARPGETAPPVIPLPVGRLTDYAITLTEQQLSDLTNGLWYVNVHTVQYPEGEIRGQLAMSTSTPSDDLAGSATTTENGVATSNLFATSTVAKELVVQAWGVDWHVIVNNATAMQGTSTLITDYSANDLVSLSGMVATSTMLGTTSTVNNGPLIVATSIQNLSVTERTISGYVVPATTTVGVPTTTAPFALELDNGEVVNITITSTTELAVPNWTTSTLLNATGTIRMTVSGLYNSIRNELTARTITEVSEVSPLPNVSTDPVTTTPATSQTEGTGGETPTTTETGADESPTTTPSTPTTNTPNEIDVV